MIKSINFAMALIFMGAFALKAQTVILKGKITDAITNEAIIGAVVNVEGGKGTTSDINGNYELKLEPNTYTIICNYVGYNNFKQKLNLSTNKVLDFSLESKTLNEVEIIADVAKIRETPIAVSNISITKIQEELGARDITMIANTTPGAYASESGGDSGDSRINIRGVDQRNVAILIDGVPVNDMENGQVFWSNWDGLTEVTKTIQIQRGLGASKLAIPSMGGTMNVLTKSTDIEDKLSLKYDIGSFNFNRVSLAYNKAISKKVAITFAGSRKAGSAFAEESFIDGWSYFTKIQYRPNSKHFFALSLTGAPQEHGQRTDRLNLVTLDRAFAEKLGSNTKRADSLVNANSPLDTVDKFSRGGDFNPAWGYLNGNRLSSRINYYHKPILNLTHLYNINSKMNLSTILYASKGVGGGTGIQYTADIPRYKNTKQDKSLDYLNDTLGQINFDNLANSINITKNALYNPLEKQSRAIIQNSVNSHFWYGGIVSLNYKILDNLKFLGGLDLRYYKGIHINTVRNLIGGDYYLDDFDANNPTNPTRLAQPLVPQEYRDLRKNYTGDTIFRNYRGIVKWGGTFGQLEYNSKRINAFFTGSYALKTYQRQDFFVKKDVKVGGKWYEQQLGFADTMFVSNGVIKVFNSNYAVANSLYGSSVSYSLKGDTVSFINTLNGIKDTVKLINPERIVNTSSNTRYHQSKVKIFPSYTLKGGFNYKFLENLNVFVNGGILQIAPAFDNVFSINNKKVFVNKESNPQKVITGEFGVGYSIFDININGNAYLTDWKNRPFTRTIRNPDGSSVNINGIDANFRGIEFDANYKALKWLEVEGFYSYGEWKYTSNAIVYPTDAAGNITDTLFVTTNKVHLGDAPQNQASLALRFMPLNGLYIKPRWSYFSRYFADLDPIGEQKEGAAFKDTWQIPDYYLVDLNLGYSFKINGAKASVGFIINNLLNRKYVSDARDGFTHDVTSATIYIGAPRRFNVSLRIEI
jgi:iron complex outermembrane recepter protein